MSTKVGAEHGSTRWEAVTVWVGLAARLLVGGVWIVAGAVKLSNLSDSVIAVKAFQLLPIEIADIVGVVLPLIEIGIGLLLVFGLATLPAAIVSCLLQLAFIIGIGAAWARGLQIECGCFGGGGQLAEGESPSYLIDILRDVGLLFCSALLVWRPRTRYSADELIFTTK